MDINFNLTNYNLHPSNRMYYVFHFKDENRANYFKNLLVEYKIHFEFDNEKTEKTTLYLFGIHKRDLKVATHLNNLTIGKFRKPFIAEPVFRYFVLVLGLGAIFLAVLGYLLKG